MAQRRVNAKWALGTLALALALPVVAQETPESLLPPGFGDAPETPQPGTQPPRPAPGTPAPPVGSTPAAPIVPPSFAITDEAGDNAAEPMSEEELAAEKQKYDLPENAHRSLDRVGPLTPEQRGLAPNAFGAQSGQFLAALMKETRAPITSRWASILLRRALLSATDTPRDIDGADWVAERAWLLLRMGEADSARLLVQSVDSDRFTPRLYAIAMQTYLATADPAGLCPLSVGALRFSKEPGWDMTRAICPALSGDQGSASGALNQAQRRGVVRGIDYRLAEKVVGTGFNARRSVKIEWDAVDRLTAWRFGLATALNVEIPDDLYATAGPHVRAWEARAPALSAVRRLPGAEVAARLGVFSSQALVGFYSQLQSDGDVPANAADRVDALRTAYAGSGTDERLQAMRTVWQNEARPDFVGLIATARAAAALPVSELSARDAANLVAAMFTAGYDRSAAQWSRLAAQADGDGAADLWALLAVGAPSAVVEIGSGRVSSFAKDADPHKAQMLIAALAGLSRLNAQDGAALAQDHGFDLAAASRWSRAIDAAAGRGEKGSVALLAAVGMQTADWNRLPAFHLYHIVAALHRVGLDPEARMIAAEAMTRL
ncbi:MULTISPECIES: hypothetical protein [Sphingobium]|uniref:Soluble lytic murein transglycosylase n=1 Tax=Sphingobium fuliginis (strain ATCC 27551) TaxID=336203 RepID=A0ABQ1ER09_SPHSA|nr:MULTISPECIES: hypothetical protein [Sphingobium]RYL99246.1 hypothetical protein EWH10_04995 [Sphingobium fuliginis]WDA36941.1 hypothetical protein PO876_01625 [Sphingobium sp. YC-XJ3]GFZ83520.1 hypothetical protein GCM10019071_09990 [Sphingobium fuliginis]